MFTVSVLSFLMEKASTLKEADAVLEAELVDGLVDLGDGEKGALGEPAGLPRSQLLAPRQVLVLRLLLLADEQWRLVLTQVLIHLLNQRLVLLSVVFERIVVF